MAKKKSSDILHQVIEIPIFDRRILVTSAPKEKWMEIAMSIVSPEDRDMLNDLEKAYAWTFSERLNYGTSRIHAWVLFETVVTPSIIVHENVHVFEVIMASCGIEQKDEELRAYFSDWLFDEVKNVTLGWGVLDYSSRR
jgi:hypothetical protein